MANQPNLIPSAWAANNTTTETIPATTTESGKASWDQGFPVETSLPLSQGGIPPKYGDFNGVLNVLSQFCLFAQSGGHFSWSATQDYSVGSIVLGTDGSLYRAAQVSGPSTTAVNPVGDTSGKWERVVSQSDIAALQEDIQDAMDTADDAASNASAAQSAVTTLDANVVKLSGAQTISGAKTFNESININCDAQTGAGVKLSLNSHTPTIGVSNVHGSFDLGYDWGAKTGAILALHPSDNNYPGNFYIYARDAINSIALHGQPDGTLTWGSNGFVYTSGDQTIAGTKTIQTPIITDTATMETGMHPSDASHGLSFYGGTTSRNGSILVLYSQGRTEYPGQFKLRASTTSAMKDMIGTPTGGLTWGGQNIQVGSDRRIKTAIGHFPDAVLEAWGNISWEQYKYIEDVERKGEENCRFHAGLIAQDVQQACEEQGQDILKYGILCHEEWQDEYETKEDGTKELVHPAGELWTVRYTEALCLEAAYQRRRADRAEARISALEQRLGELEAVLASLAAPVGDETYEQFTEQEQGASDEN